MSEQPVDVAGALVEVRHAYRLLHAYHQRLSDLMKMTHESLLKAGLTFVEWGPLKVWLPRPKRAFFHHWAWDLTPAYQAGCVWAGESAGRQCKVHIHAIADTGYPTDAEEEPDPSRFEPAEATTSEIRVGMYRTLAKKPDWDGAWEKLSPKGNRKNGSDHKVTVDNEEYAHRYFAINLAELTDASAIEERLLRPIEQWLARP